MSVGVPDPKAQINYYAPYLVYPDAEPVNTIKASWLTHLEEDREWKASLWQKTAEKMDLRCISTDLYWKEVRKFGPTAKLIPGVDRKFFVPKKHGKQKELVGISGIARARKGVALAARLMVEKDELGVEVRITGRGWPWKHTWLAWEAMPDFYNTLEVYLCTSLIEGIPMPPLEALSCGTKVVIPRGVGMLDELPEIPGVRHFDKGDYEDMKRALKRALDDKVKAEELRAVIEKYTIDRWCESHFKAFELLVK